MSRPTLLLLPGILCDDAVWAAQCAALAPQAECRVASYGELDSIAAMAEQVLAGTSAPRFAVAAHSMGGRVALEMMRRAPERIERLALLDTGYEPLATGIAGAQERARRLELLEIAQRQGMRAMGRQWAPGMMHPRRLDTPLFEAVLQMIERSTPRIYAAQIAALLGRPDATPVLATIRCPTLLLCGRQDAWSPLARHEQMAAAIPHARLMVVEDAGHMSTMEQPEAVTQALAQWLRQGPGQN